MKKMSKKLISLILSVLMVASMLPTFALTATADEVKDHFLFAYFTGNGDAATTENTNQAIRLATSTDGINFSALNRNKAIITQEGGTKNARDPYIFEGQDGAYYMVATDADYSNGDWGKQQKQIVFWKSTDLITWTDETYINIEDVYNNYSSETVTVWKAWAPEVFFDTETGKYMVYLAIDDGHNTNTMHYMLTDDLFDQSKYSEPQTLYAPADGKASIDGDIVEQNGVYYMFYKDEGQGTVSLVKADHAVGPYTYVGKMETSSATGAIEGCEVYMIGDDYYLIADRYGDNGKFAIYNLGSDLSKLSAVDGVISTTNGNPVTTVNPTTGFQNLSVRHGSVIKITQAQADALNEAYPSTSTGKVENVGLIAEYFTDSDVTLDHTGNGHNLSNGGVAWWNAADHLGEWGSYGEDCAYFNGSSSAQVNDLLKNTGVTTSTGFAVEFMGFVYNNEEARRYIDLGTSETLQWTGSGLQDTSTGNYDASYVALGASGKLFAKTSSSNWDANTGGLASYYREWHKFLVTVSKDEVSYYCDGALITTLDSSEELVADLINNGDLKFGKSSFAGDAKMDGLMKNVRVYDHACAPTDVAGLSKETMIANNAANWMQNSGADVITWLKDNAATSSVKTATANAYFYTNEEAGYYSNVLYGSQDVNWSSDYVTIGSSDPKLKFKYSTPSNVVMMYDGINDAYYGVKAEMRTSTNNSNSSKRRTLNYISSNNSNFSFRENWKCVKSQDDWNQWMSQGFNGETGFTNENRTNLGDIYNLKDSSWFLYNKLYVNNDINFNGGYYVKETPSAHALWNSDTQGDFGNTASIYAINYKPIAEKYDAVKNMVATVIADEDDYCSTGLASFYKAAYNVLSLDPNSYFAGIDDSQVESAVQSCASAISTAAAKLSVATTEPVKHSWNDGEITTPATCQDKGVKTYTCANCGDTYTEDVDPVEHNYVMTSENDVYTFTCNAGCNDSYTIDKSALAAAIVSANAIKNADDYKSKYTLASRSNFESALADAKAVMEADVTAQTQDTINAAVSALETAENALEATGLAISFQVVDSESNAVLDTFAPSDVQFGDTLTYNYVIETETEGVYAGLPKYTVYKWVRTVKSADEKLSNASSSIEIVATASATYTLYVLPFAGSNEVEDQTRVRYLDKSNKTIDVKYVATGSQVTPDADVEAPAVPFYTFAGWEKVFGNDESADSREVVFKATYVFDDTEANKCNIVAVGDIKVNNKASDKVGYDMLVTLSGADAYAYCDEAGNIISAITGTTIYAPHSEVIYVTKLETELPASTLVTGDFITDNGAYKTLTVNAQYYVPADKTADECGIVVSKTVATPEIGATGCTKVKSNVQGANHEYSIAMNYSVPGTLYVTPYVIVNGETVYGNAVEITLE